LEEAAKEKKRAAEDNKQKGRPLATSPDGQEKEIHAFCREKLLCTSGTQRLTQGKREQS
jgi:hypothetical protein